MDAVLYLFGLLLFGHALADFALQSDGIMRDKRRENAPKHWWVVLSGHAMIHGGFVLLFLGSPLLGFLEFVAHFVIDFGKGEKWYGLVVDQTLHMVCKVLWLCLLLAGIR